VISYSDWASGEPNNGGDNGNEHCVVFSTGGKWNDYVCTAPIDGYYYEYDCPGVLIQGAYGCICKTYSWWFLF
jgi:hypothetical protein